MDLATPSQGAARIEAVGDGWEPIGVAGRGDDEHWLYLRKCGDVD